MTAERARTLSRRWLTAAVALLVLAIPVLLLFDALGWLLLVMSGLAQTRRSYWCGWLDAKEGDDAA